MKTFENWYKLPKVLSLRTRETISNNIIAYDFFEQI